MSEGDLGFRLYPEEMVCHVCRRLNEYCVCTRDSIKMVEYVEVTMVIVCGEETIECPREVQSSVLCAGQRFAEIVGLDVVEYEVFDYDESSKRLIIYQLSPIDTRPAEMRVLADKLNPNQEDK